MRVVESINSPRDLVSCLYTLERPRHGHGLLDLPGSGASFGGRRQCTWRSRPAQCGSRSSRLRILPAPDFGSGSVRISTERGTL